VVLAHKTTLDEAYVDTFIASSAQAAGVPPTDLQGLKDAVMGFVGMVKDNPAPWAANQTHIALGTLVAAASEKGIDNCPMGGFNADAFDEILGLKELGLHATAIVALGHRSESDPAASRAKSRFSLDEVVIKR
jgi:nitroreductase